MTWVLDFGIGRLSGVGRSIHVDQLLTSATQMLSVTVNVTTDSSHPTNRHACSLRKDGQWTPMRYNINHTSGRDDLLGGESAPIGQEIVEK